MSDALAQVLTQMVRPYFKLRYQTAADALQALHQTPDQTAVQFSPKPFTPPLESATSALEPTQVVASPTPARPPQRPSPPVAKSSGCAPWVFGFGAMALVMGLGMVGLTYWGVTDELFPFLQPEVANVDNGAALLEQAQQEARQSGDLDAAIAIATQIPSNSDSAEAAQTQIQTWQTAWQQQQDLFNRAKTAFDAKRWHVARDLAFKLPQNPYWDRRADPIYFAAKRKITDLERPTPTPTPTPTEPPEPTLEPSPSPDPTQPEEPTLSPSPEPSPIQSPVVIPVPLPTPTSPSSAPNEDPP